MGLTYDNLSAISDPLSVSDDVYGVVQNRSIFQHHVQGTIQAIHKRIVPNPDAPLTPQQIHRIYAILNFALELPSIWPVTRDLLLVIAPKMEQAGERGRWLKLLQKGVAVGEAAGDIAASAALQVNLGLLYQWATQWSLAADCYRASIHLYRQLQCRTEQAHAVNRLAYLLRLQGEIEAAEVQAKAALALLATDDLERGFTYFVLGTIAEDHAEWQEAEAHFRRSVALSEQSNQPRTIAKHVRALGWALCQQQKHCPARDCLERAIRLFAQIQDPLELAVTQMNLGVVYSYMGQPHSALNLYADAERVFQQAQDDLYLAMIYNNQGWEYRKLRRWSDAEAALKASIDLYHETEQPLGAVNALDNLARVYIDWEQKPQALATLLTATQLLTEISEHPGADALRAELNEQLKQAENMPVTKTI